MQNLKMIMSVCKVTTVSEFIEQAMSLWLKDPKAQLKN